MKIVESPREAYAQIDAWRRQGRQIGLVPTMGALHEGHLSLVRRSIDECDLTAATIFLNPAQFGPNEDLSRYPRTLDADLSALSSSGVDLAFVPNAQEMYPKGYTTYVSPPACAATLEGEFRPNHFRGVVTIVLKLFHVLAPHVAYFGQKDYQQLTVIHHMVQDLNVAVHVEACETIRESDGLAMSSRNRYLSESERVKAGGLWQALTRAKQLFDTGTRNTAELESTMLSVLSQSGIDRVDYARVVDGETLESISEVDRPCVALVAAYVGPTRLIDNLQL